MFTPGPWFAVNCGTEDEPMYSVKAARIKGKPPRHEVCICATGDSPQDMETANARLIAAAPDLLEALKTARHQVYLFARPDDPIAQAVLQIVDAVIFRATGT